jgi:putative membrane protein
MKHLWKSVATGAAICALTALPASGQSTSGSSGGATDQAGSKPAPHTSGTSGQSSTAGTPPGERSGQAHESGAAGKVTSADRTFIMAAAAGGMAEVQMGKLATDKASSEDVKRFGQMMVDDHTKANNELMKIAKDKQLTPPHALKPQDQQTYDKLSKLSGEQFDRQYMQVMVEDHTKDVAEFKKASQSASDPDVKAFAASTLPTLQKHLDDAKDIHGKVMGHGPRGTSGTKDNGHPDTSGSGSNPPPRR